MTKQQKERNFLKFLGVYFAIALVAIISTCCVVGCDGKNPIFPDRDQRRTSFEEKIDSISKENIREAINPLFESVEEVVIYREMSKDGMIIDSIFNSLSQKTLMDVANVCIKRLNAATKGDIVHEYLEHKDVYKNLPGTVVTTDTNTQEEEYTVKTAEDDVISTSYSYRTDTVDGKPRKVQVKKEEKYVTE